MELLKTWKIYQFKMSLKKTSMINNFLIYKIKWSYFNKLKIMDFRMKTLSICLKITKSFRILKMFKIINITKIIYKF